MSNTDLDNDAWLRKTLFNYEIESHSIRIDAISEVQYQVKMQKLLETTESAILQHQEAEIRRRVSEAQLKALDTFEHRIDCNTLISELESWRSCIENAKEQSMRLLGLDKLQQPGDTV